MFRPRVKKIKMDLVMLEHKLGFKPTQPPRHQVTYHYRDRLSKHIALMRKKGVVEDVNPREPIDAVLNLIITVKKTRG